MHSLSKFFKMLQYESEEIPVFCRDPIVYLAQRGYETTDLPEKVEPLPADRVATLTSVDDLRRLMAEHSPVKESVSPEAAVAGDSLNGRLLAAPPAIFVDTAAEPIESGGANASGRPAKVAAGLPFPEFAEAFKGRAETCNARRRWATESIATSRFPAAAPSPVFETLPDAGQSGAIALQRIIGLPAGTPESAAAEAIILADDRVRVMDTTVNPFRWLCRLEITASTGSKWLGTGWFIAPGVIVTAGHCVYMHNHGGWVQSIAVHVGQNETIVQRSITATQFATTRGWAERRDATNDYGVIFVSAGGQGYFGYGVLGDTLISGALGNITGYPQDKPAGSLWGHTKQMQPPTSKNLFYEIDTFGGMSGAPVVIWDGQDYVAIGIHNYGDTTANSASRITEEVFRNFERWKSFGATV